jgi:hypothetical protein
MYKHVQNSFVGVLWKIESVICLLICVFLLARVFFSNVCLFVCYVIVVVSSGLAS